MLDVSTAYKELVTSNMRPKVEPVISVMGEDVNGNTVSLSWNASNIQTLNYKRGIDPVGREIAYMELTWTEIYTGNLNEENYPEKYNNIVKYMAVDLTFVQDMSFSWESDTEQTVLNMPRMFLVSKPVIDGRTITWTARDLLYFLTESQTKSFTADVPYRNALRWFLLEERANFRNSKEILTAIQNTQSNILIGVTSSIGKNIVIDGSSKDILTNLASIKNYYWSFAGDTAKLESFTVVLQNTNPNAVLSANPSYTFTSNVMYDYPKLTALPTISGYSFKQYVCELDEENQYTLSPYETVTYKGTVFYHYAFKGLGSATSLLETAISKSVYSREKTINVIPANLNSIDFYISLNQKGEDFIEDNPCNPYSSNDRSITSRKSALNNYFIEGSYTAEINSLPNLSLEPGDFVAVETNLYSGNKNITKKALVLTIELEYNGALKQKTTIHTR